MKLFSKLPHILKFSQENNLNQLILSSFDRKEEDQLFVEYIRYVNNQARQTLNNELITKWKSLFEKKKLHGLKMSFMNTSRKNHKNSRKPTNVGFFVTLFLCYTTGFLSIKQ